MNRYEEIELQQDLEQVEKYLSGYLRDPGYGSAAGQILRDMEMSRGKRLRPRLLLMASRYGSEFQGSRIRLCRLGALVELVHMASLIHDDIVDDAPLRRGMPTTQSKYGKDMAVTVDQYMSNIYGKTAALCRLACVAGAVESGCSDEVTSQLEQLGINFGYMFQIRDDLLDFISTSAEEGKPTQVDFREGIYTLPVIYAMQDGEYRPRIIRLMQLAKKGGFGAAEEEELKALVVDSGGLAHASTDMKIYAQKAMRAVENLPDHGVSTVFRELLHKNM